MLHPSLRPGCAPRFDQAVRQGRLQHFHGCLVRRFQVVLDVPVNPQPFQALDLRQGGQILHIVLHQVQVHQVVQVFQAGDVRNPVMEDFQVFQMLQARDRRNIRQVAQRHNQHPEFRHFIKEVQFLHRMVPDIQGIQVFAPCQHFYFLIGMLPVSPAVEGGEGGVIRPDPVPSVAELDAELHIREKLVQFFVHFQVDHRIVHIYFFEVRQLLQKSVKTVPVSYAAFLQIHIFCICADRNPTVCDCFCLLRRNRPEEHQQKHQKRSSPFENHSVGRTFPLL